jgi:hypothetical protein
MKTPHSSLRSALTVTTLLLVLTLSSCASYRKRKVTITDSAGKPASSQEVKFENIIPVPFFPPIQNATGVLDENGSVVMRMPVTTGRLSLRNEASIQLVAEQVIDGASNLEMDRHPNPLFPGISVAGSEWRATISKR